MIYKLPSFTLQIKYLPHLILKSLAEFAYKTYKYMYISILANFAKKMFHLFCGVGGGGLCTHAAIDLLPINLTN